jgi:LCP family protein required for cell wall assembly
VLLLVIVLSMVVLGGAYAYQRFASALNKISSAQDVRVQPTSNATAPTPELLQRPFNVLVIGVDMREDPADEGVRSDTLIVAHIDPLEKWAAMLSIPRDTVVNIPVDGCSSQKINAAYACGYNNPKIYGNRSTPEDSGVALVADTVEDYLGITIDYTMQVDFNGFQQLVDAVGGITIDVPRAILDSEYPTENNGFMRLYYPTGLQRMNGVQALRYARTRHVDSDFGRAQRQQQVVQAALDEIKRRDMREKIEAAPKLLDALSESVRTTMPLNNISTLQGLAELAQNLSPDRVKRLVLKPETNPDGSNTLIGDYINVRWDPAYLRRMVHELQTPPGAPNTAADKPVVVQVQNGTRQRGLASQVTTDLDTRGFKMATADDAPNREERNTLILDYTGNETAARQIAKLLNVDEQYIRDASNEPAPPNVDLVVRLGEDYQPVGDTQATPDNDTQAIPDNDTQATPENQSRRSTDRTTN